MNKKFKKLSGIALLSSAIVLTPYSNAKASSTYTLNKNVNKYMDAYDAKSNKNALGQYASGEYYIYKKYKGMINISKDKNQAGAWIDPRENKTNNSSKKEKSVKSDQYILEDSTTGYINADDAKNNRNDRTTLSKGKYYIYKEYNGMLNLSKNKNVAGAWINPKDSKIEEVKSIKDNSEKKIVKKSSKNNDNKYELSEEKNGYFNSSDAKNGVNPRTTLSKGTYYIYKEYKGMLNLTNNKNEPGAWVNIDEKFSKEIEVKTSNKEASSSSPMKYSLNNLQYHGVIRWNGKKFTYYSQRVLPGNGLNIPGRHVNEAGYVSDKDGYIVLANDAPKGTVIDTPFGFKGKVYDRGTYGNHFDVYTR